MQCCQRMGDTQPLACLICWEAVWRDRELCLPGPDREPCVRRGDICGKLQGTGSAPDVPAEHPEVLPCQEFGVHDILTGKDGETE